MTNALQSIRSNIFYLKDKESDEYEKNYEIILICDAPEYTKTNTGEIIQLRAVVEKRFSISAENLKVFAATLAKLADSTEDDYQ